MKYQKRNVLDYLFRLLTLVQLQNRNFVGDIKLIIPKCEISGNRDKTKWVRECFKIHAPGSCVALFTDIFECLHQNTEIKMRGGITLT